MRLGKTTWRLLLIQAMEERGESMADLVSITLADEQLDKRFNDGYGGSEGDPFTAWTANTVYFPIVYDGAEWVGSVSRNPDGKPTAHQGGQ